MKLGVSMYCYVREVKSGRMNWAGFVEEARRIGADGVELLDFFYSDPDSEREEVKRLLAGAGMPCCVFSVANNFAKVSAEERQAQVRRVAFGVDEAVFFGADVVRVFAGDVNESAGYDDSRAWIVAGLSEAADYARSQGVRLALENHGKLAGRGSQILEIVRDVRERCGHDTLWANPDTGNFVLVDEDSVQAVREVATVAAMCHFKDFMPGDGPYESLAGKTFRGSVIGKGCVDLLGCANALVASGFKGWFNLEYEGAGDPLGEVEASLANARRILENAETLLYP